MDCFGIILEISLRSGRADDVTHPREGSPVDTHAAEHLESLRAVEGESEIGERAQSDNAKFLRIGLDLLSDEERGRLLLHHCLQF